MPIRNTRLICILTAVASPLAITTPAAASPPHWPSFRGPQASGIADGQNPPIRWDVEKGINVKWKTPIPGLAHSSPIVWGERVFVTSAVSDNPDPYLRVGLYGESPGHPEDIVHNYNLYCLDKSTGQISWQQTAHSGKPQVKRHIKSSHANPTPATDGTHIVVSFGSEGLYCYDFDGKLLWKQDLGVLDSGAFDAPEIQWGFGSSPTICNNKVIVLCDVNNQSFIAAFDIDTGKQLWRTLRDEVPTWGTPTVVEHNGRTQVIVNGWHHIGGYDVATGKEFWQMHGGGDIPIPTPIVAHGLVFITNAHGRMSPVYAIRLGARGDISLNGNETSNEYVAWSKPRRGAYIPTPIVYGDYLYVGNDIGILTCYEAKTGKQMYRERIASRRDSYSASAVASDGRLYFTTENGDVHVVKAGPEYEHLATNPIGGYCLATPAVSDGTLFIRTSKHLYAICDKGEAVASAQQEPPKADPQPADEKPAKAESTAKPGTPSGEVGELSDPLEILKRVDAACKAVNAVRYDVTVEATGALTQYIGSVKAAIVASGYAQFTPEKFKVDGLATLRGGSEPRPITGGSDGDLYYVFDYENQRVHADLDVRVMGSLARPVTVGIMPEYLVAEPFSDEINTPTKELRGSKTIGGEECYEVYVVYESERSPKATWYFSKKDFLPRARFDEYTLGDGGTGVLKRVVTNLVTDPKLDEDAFKLRLPDGYERTDEPAP